MPWHKIPEGSGQLHFHPGGVWKDKSSMPPSGSERIVIPYAPRRVFLPYHDRTQRFAVGVAHRRCGKTVAAVNDKIRRAVSTDKSMYRAAYIAPFLRQAKDVAWEYLKKYAAPVMSRAPNESELWVEVNSSGGPARIRIYGADNADALRGGYLDDATLDEFADMRPGVWGEIIRPMLADRHGSATFIGTPKGRNAFYDLYAHAGTDAENWFRFRLPASETGILPQSELDAARRDMTPEQYDQEFECSFEAAILGAYYGREMAQAEREGRLRLDLLQPTGPLHCAWDFGNGANMAVWAFEISPSGPIVHDFIQASGWYFEDYLKEVARRGYDGTDYVPHDAKVPSFETGRTRIETMLAFKRKPVLVADLGVDDGINAGKITLRQAVFNATTCSAGLEALRQYRQDWDEKARVFRPVPKHDWASHPADAWRYLSVAWKHHIAPIAEDVVPLFRPLEQLTVKQFIDIEMDRHERRERV